MTAFCKNAILIIIRFAAKNKTKKGCVRMRIHGLNKTTLLDYPEHVAATVFCGGCNFCCPFCYNSSLVLDPGSQPRLEEKEVLDFLKKRRGILSGVCITGGEPALQPDLAEFAGRVKDLGYLVKLDTNGYKPEVLEVLVERKLLDYIAMDIKAGPSKYGQASGVLGLDWKKIQSSIDFIMGCGVQYEFRTTVVKGIHTKEDFAEIGRLLAGAAAYYLQAFQDQESVMQREKHFTYFEKEQMEEFAGLVRPFVQKVGLRGA